MWDLYVDGTLAGCEAPATVEEFARLAWRAGTRPGPLRPIRGVYGGDPTRRRGIEVHTVAIEDCADCAARRVDPHNSLDPDWARYVQHPLRGEDLRAMDQRLRAKGKSDYFWYGSEDAYVADIAAALYRCPVTDVFGVKEPNAMCSAEFLYHQGTFPPGAAFPDDFGRRPGLVEAGVYPREAFLTRLAWERYDGLGCSDLEAGGRLYTSLEIKNGGGFERTVGPFLHAIADIVLDLVPRTRPALAWCGESPMPQNLALRVARRRELWFVNWINVYGPPYVEAYGRDFLLGAPGHLKRELPDGSILYQVTPGLAPSEAGDPPPREVEDYFRAHAKVHRVAYRPWLKTRLATEGRRAARRRTSPK